MKRFLYALLSLPIVLATIFLFAPEAKAAYGDVTTYLGKIYAGDGGSRVDAYFDFPEDVDIDASGNFFIADTYDNVIRKIDANGIVSTVAGTGSYGNTTGSTTTAEFALPHGASVASDGAIYVADTANNQIKKISGSTVTTLVSSGLSGPEGVEVYGSRLYIADTGNNAIKYVSTSGGAVSTLTTNVDGPKKLAANGDGTVLYIADADSHRVLSVNTSSGAVTVVAGSGAAGYQEGTGASAVFNNVWGVALDGTTLYVSDGDGYTDYIRKINLTTGATSLFAEDGSMASINYPAGLDIYNGSVYVSNSGIGTIHRFLTTLSGDEEIFAGYERYGNRNGSSSTALFGRPSDMVKSPDGKYIYVADNNKIRRVTVATGEVSQVVGSSVDNYREGDDDPTHGIGPARFSGVQSITINSSGTRLYVVDRWNNRIRGVNLEVSPAPTYLVSGAGLVNTIGTDDNGYQEGVKCADQLNTGVAGCAYFRSPTGIVIDPTDTYLYVVDSGNNRIRKVRISDGQTWLVAGTGATGYADGAGTSAKFNRPFGLTMDASGSNLYIADSNNHVIRKINLTSGTVSTLAGNASAGYREAIGTNAVLSFPEFIKMGADNLLYFSDTGSHRVRLADPTTGLTKLVAGSGERGFKNGNRTTTEFNNLKGLLPDTASRVLYVTDQWNDLIRRIDITGTAPYAEAAPTVTAVTPNQVNPAWDKGSGLNVKVDGTNFTFGAKTYFGDTVSEATYVQSGTSLAVKLPLSQMSTGWYDVTVVSLDGQKSTKERAIGITDSAGNVPSTYHQYSNKTSDDVSTPSTYTPSVASGFSFMAYASTLRAGYHIAGGNVIAGGHDEIITGTGDGLGPQVRVFDGSGNVQSQFFAYASTLRSGVRVAACDLTGDGIDEIVTAPGPGGKPHIRIFNGTGTPLTPGFFALDGKFTGGVYVTCGDTDGNGIKEIIVTAGKGGGAQVMVYNQDGHAMANFFAYDKATFRKGIKAATADVDGDGKDEIIVGPEFGASHTQIFQIRPNEIKLLSPGFFAFNKDYRGGVSVAGVDTDGDGIKEIVVGVGENATPLIRVFNVREEMQKEFFAYATNYLNGVNVAGADVDGDGADELLTIPRASGGPNVRVIDVEGI
ncbi:MAG: FG-GAP-like repeat-containing protein [Patescibacteria group bacterium]|jgi:DNA-binding beta-propeller fold protein YncE